MVRYTEEKLAKMSVHTLRVILRSEFNGVPGTCNKSELISQILDIQSGGDAPFRSTKGRKPLGEFITPINAELTFSDVEDDFENPDGVVKGIFELNAEGYGLLRKRVGTSRFTDYFVAKMIVKRHSLKTGDVLEASVENLLDTAMPRVKSVSFINGKSPECIEKVERLEDLTSSYPVEKISLRAEGVPNISVLDTFCPIGKGQRCLVSDADGMHGTDFIKSLIKCASHDENLRILALFVGAKPEDLVDIYQGENVSVIALPTSESSQDVIRIVNLTLERAKIDASQGKDVLLMVDSLSAVVDLYEDYLSSQSRDDGFLKVGVTQNKYACELFGAGGNFGQGRSLTIVATYNTNGDGRLQRNLKGIATSVIDLKSSDVLERRGYAIDLNTSYTQKDELLLTKEQIQYCDEEREKLSREQGYYKEIYKKLAK